MPANQFGRYVWLVDTLRQHKHLTYKEINEKWKQSGLSYGDDDDLPLRTFHNHRKAILDTFGIIIELDHEVTGYKYHIVNPEELEGDGLRSWLIDSYATLNQLQADSRLRDRVAFEDIPSGHRWLTLFMQAMRENRAMEITYQGFGRDHENTFVINPYSLKVAKRRWYIVAASPYYEDWNQRHRDEEGFAPRKEILVYGLDRILNAKMLDTTFVMPKDFSMQQFFQGCVGVTTSDAPTETVVIKAYGQAPDYLRSLPLHESQQETDHGDGYALFSYEVKLTYDFLQLIMQQGDQVEVLAPASLREQMRNMANTLISYYKD